MTSLRCLQTNLNKNMPQWVREPQPELKTKTQRKRCTERQREIHSYSNFVFYPSIIGKTSTVSSALKLDIDPSISSPASTLSSSLSLSSWGTAHIPFWWSLLFHSALPSLLFLLLLYLCHSSHLRFLSFCVLLLRIWVEVYGWDWRLKESGIGLFQSPF